MLTSMRKGVSSILAKALLLFLVVVFGMWGIGDALRSGSAGSIATIGNISITPQAFESRLQRITRSIPNLPPEMANSDQLKMQVLQGMVQQSLLTLEATRLGLVMDKKTIAQLIASNENFKDEKGVFSPQAFSTFLRDNNMNEQNYIDALTRDTLSAALLDSLGMKQPLTYPFLASELDAASRQSRTSEAWFISSAQVPLPKAPDEKALKAYYQKVKSAYMTPEKRSIDYVSIKSSVIKDSIRLALSNEELMDRYNIEKASLSLPETRNFEQWLFKDEQIAKSAIEAIKSGVSPTGSKSTSLKNITQNTLPKDISDAVFSLKKNGVSSPIKTGFGWQVFKVTEIIPAKIPSFAASKKRIEDILIAEKLDEQIQDFSGQIEDALSAGDSIEKAARILGKSAQYGSLSDVTSEQSLTQSDNVKSHVLKRGFSLADGENSGLEPTTSDELVSTWVRSISPSSPKPLSAIKEALVAAYIKDTHAQDLAAYAYKFSAELSASNDTASLADKANISIVPLAAITLQKALSLTDEIAQVPAQLTRELFETDLGKYTAPAKNSKGDWVLLKVKQIAQTLPKDDNSESALSTVNTALENDIYSYYLASLQKRYPVTVNHALFQQKDAQK